MSTCKQILCFMFLFSSTLVFTGCASRPQPPGLTLIPYSEYEDLVFKNTKRKQVYDGFSAVVDISATLLKSPVRLGQVDQLARFYQWTPENYATEKQKATEELTQKTEIFLSFFVPERKQDDLHRSTSLWKLFLDVNGKRYEGKATRIKGVFADLQSLYPQLSRWGTAYKVTFNVPTTTIENSKSSFLVTGPVTSAKVEFD